MQEKKMKVTNQEEFHKLIDEVYAEYKVVMTLENSMSKNKEELLTKEQFIDKLKSDSQFRITWSVRIEEREFTPEERYDIWLQNNYETGMEKNYADPPDFDNPYYVPTPKSGTVIYYLKPTKLLIC